MEGESGGLHSTIAAMEVAEGHRGDVSLSIASTSSLIFSMKEKTRCPHRAERKSSEREQRERERERADREREREQRESAQRERAERTERPET